MKQKQRAKITNAAGPPAVPSMQDLPQELLSLVFRVTGVQSVLSSLPKNSKLHGAWQAAVRSFKNSTDDDHVALNEDDIAILKKLVNLEKLRLFGCDSDDAPVWKILAQVVPALTRLTSIALIICPRGSSALPVLASMDGMRTRLQELEIENNCEDFSAHDLWALEDLKAVSKLMIGCSALIGDPAQLLRPCSKLGHIRNLHLEVHDKEGVSAEQLAVFPGSLTALTALSLAAARFERRTDEAQLLASALSAALSNLQRLSTDLLPDDAAAQQQVLAHVKQLTYLRAVRPVQEERYPQQLHVLQHLPKLEVLEALRGEVQDPFSHPCLRKLTAHYVEVSDEWSGIRKAEGCSIEELVIDRGNESTFCDMPLLPELHTLGCQWPQPGNGRYVHLAALLRRQARTLQSFWMRSSTPLEDMLPRELPAMKELRMLYGSISRATLQLLGMCSMPALQELELFLSLGKDRVVGLDVGADLAWLRRLPALKKCRLVVSGKGEQQVAADVQALMQGSRVENEIDIL